jgi:hypothetical protein
MDESKNSAYDNGLKTAEISNLKAEISRLEEALAFKKRQLAVLEAEKVAHAAYLEQSSKIESAAEPEPLV